MSLKSLSSDDCRTILKVIREYEERLNITLPPKLSSLPAGATIRLHVEIISTIEPEIKPSVGARRYAENLDAMPLTEFFSPNFVRASGEDEKFYAARALTPLQNTIKSVRELREYTYADLLRIPNIGRQTVQFIARLLKANGLALREGNPHPL